MLRRRPAACTTPSMRVISSAYLLLAACATCCESVLRQRCYGKGFPTSTSLSLWARCEMQHNTSYPVIGFSVENDEMGYNIDIEYTCSDDLSTIEEGAVVQTNFTYGQPNQPYTLLSEAGKTCVVYGCILGYLDFELYQIVHSPIVVSCSRDLGDECDLSCSTHAECRGAPGNYSCVCEPGFTGDGYNCTDISPPAKNCTPTDSDCMNTNSSDVRNQTSNNGTDEKSMSRPTDISPPAKNCTPTNLDCTNTSDSDVGNQTSTPENVTPSQGTEAMDTAPKLPMEWVAATVSLAILLVVSIATSLVIFASYKVKKAARRRRRAKRYNFMFGKGLWGEIDHNYNPVRIEPNPAMRYSPAVSIFEKLEKWDDTAKEDNCVEETCTLSSSAGLSLNSNSSGFVDHQELLHNGHSIPRHSDLQPLSMVRCSSEEIKESQMDTSAACSLAHSSGIGSPQNSSDTTSLVSGKDEDGDPFDSASGNMPAGWPPHSCGYTTYAELLISANSKARQSSGSCTSTEFCTTHQDLSDSPFRPHCDTTGSSGYGSEYTGIDAHLHEHALLHDTTGSSGYASEYNAPSEYLSSDAFLSNRSPSDSRQLVGPAYHDESKNKPFASHTSSEQLFLITSESEDITQQTTSPQALMETPGYVSMLKLNASVTVPSSTRTKSCSPLLEVPRSRVFESRSNSCGSSHVSLSDYQLPTSRTYDCEQDCDSRNRVGVASTSPQECVSMAPTSFHVPRQRSTSPCYHTGYITTESLLVGSAN